jgi:hypothetical protein
MGSTVDLDYIDPDTGDHYYRAPEGFDLVHESRGIGIFISTSTSFFVRNNKIQAQSTGIVTEFMAGTGDIVITDNEISVTNATFLMDRNYGVMRRGYELDVLPLWFAEIPFARAVRVENNTIRVVGEPEDGFSVGLMMGTTDAAFAGYDGTVIVKNNEIAMQNGDSAVALGDPWLPAVLEGAEIRNNHIRGAANYGLLSRDLGLAANCVIMENDLTELKAARSQVYLEGGDDNIFVENTFGGVTNTSHAVVECAGRGNWFQENRYKSSKRLLWWFTGESVGNTVSEPYVRGGVKPFHWRDEGRDNVLIQ